MKKLIIFTLFYLMISCAKKTETSIHFVELDKINLQDILGQEIEKSKQGRISHFIQNDKSEAIQIFHKDTAQNNIQGDWRGEHAGKWLYTASRTAFRTGDTTLKKNIDIVLNFLISQQSAEGYIGTYTDSMRFFANPKKPRQTWDVWTSSYLLQGMLAYQKYFFREEVEKSMLKLADLYVNTFLIEGKNLANTGCFSGMASAGAMGTFVDLYQHTGNTKYLEMAKRCHLDLDERPGTEMLQKLLKGYDVALIGEGKMYEMLRCVEGYAKLYQITLKKDYLTACLHAWNNIKEQHLSPAGAPFGGVNIHPECFNLGYSFNPYANSETCATMDWIRFNKELYKASGDVKYLNELELTFYNAVLGASFDDGYGWVYHSHTNGKKERTGEWACCSSSGALIMEEISETALSYYKGGIAINHLGALESKMNLKDHDVKINIESKYPVEGKIEILISSKEKLKFPVYLRIPQWASNAVIKTDNSTKTINESSGYEKIEYMGQKMVIELNIPISNRSLTYTREYNELGHYLDGKTEYLAIYRGPLLYATEHEDILKSPNPIIINRDLDQLTKNSTDSIGNVHIYIQSTLGEHIFKPFYIIGKKEDTYRSSLVIKR